MNAAIVIQNGPPWWLVVLPAVTALAGVGLGALWHGRQENKKWHRDAVLAYSARFITSVHSFETMVMRFVAGDDDAELAHDLGRAREGVAESLSLVELTAPLSLVVLAAIVFLNVGEVSRGVGASKKSDSPGIGLLDEVRKSRDDFKVEAQKILGTRDLDG